MQDLPQQPPDYEVVIPLEQGNHSSVTQDDLEFQVLEPPTPPMAKLEEKDLFNLTHFLHRKYEKGFTWAAFETQATRTNHNNTHNTNMRTHDAETSTHTRFTTDQAQK